MTPTEVAEETVLVGLLLALAVTYVVNRVQLAISRRDVKRILGELQAMEARLRERLDVNERRDATAELQRLESRMTTASKRLIAWRESSVERFIIGRHVEQVLYDCERAGAMAMRLLAIIRQ